MSASAPTRPSVTRYSVAAPLPGGPAAVSAKTWPPRVATAGAMNVGGTELTSLTAPRLVNSLIAPLPSPNTSRPPGPMAMPRGPFNPSRIGVAPVDPSIDAEIPDIIAVIETTDAARAAARRIFVVIGPPGGD